MEYQHKNRLTRLAPSYYQGFAWVHWTLTIEHRRTGWLDPKFFYKFREVLTHSCFRYQVACPVFCLMPDHIHCLWHGLTNESDQLLAMKHFRKEVNTCLKAIGFQFQRQAYDSVLKEDHINETAIEDVVEYIARNPEREGLVELNEFAAYPFTGAVLPGYPNFRLFEELSWQRLWRIVSYQKRTALFRNSEGQLQ